MRTRECDWKRGLYRSRDGMVFGVCKGLADHLDFSVVWLRLIVVVLMLLGFIVIPIIVYLVAALLMKPEPVVPFASESDREFYDSYVSSRPLAIDRLKRTYGNLDRRIRRMETIVTSRDFQWNKRMSE